MGKGEVRHQVSRGGLLSHYYREAGEDAQTVISFCLD